MKVAWMLVFAWFTSTCAHYSEAKAGDISLGIHRASQVIRRDECGFSGNPDIYGLGIRIGYYSQALSVWTANFFVVSESKKLRSVNTLFMFAMFIGLIWISHDPTQTYAIEAFLLIQLLSTTWYVGILNQSKFSSKNWKFSPLRMVIQDLTLLGILSYSIWFWWIGLDRMQKTPCGTYIFFLSKVSLYGWYRSGFKILSAIAVAFNLIILSGHMAQLVQHRATSYTRCPEFFGTLRKNLISQCEKKAPYSVQQESSHKNPASSAAAGEILTDSTDYGTLSQVITAEVGRPKNTDTPTSDQDQPSKKESAAKVLEGPVGRILPTQNTTENVGPSTRTFQDVTVNGSAGQESNAGGAKFQPNVPTQKEPTLTKPGSATLTSTPSHCASPGSTPISPSASGKPISTAVALESASQESMYSLNPIAVPQDRSSKIPSPTLHANPTSTPSSRFFQARDSEKIEIRDPNTPNPFSAPLSFSDILTVDVYLDGILKDSVLVDTMRAYKIPHTSVKILIPSIDHFRKLNFKGRNRRFRLNIIIPLFIHIYYLRTYNFPLYPTLLSRALNHPHHAKISPESLATTIILRKSRLSINTPPYYYLPSAFCTLTVCVGLVLAIELSLFWNGVTGVTNMGQVGQLVPFVIGIGGLVKVLWVCWKGPGKEEEGEGTLEREVRLCAEVYEGTKGHAIGKNENV